jgi:hypothetical protein
VSAELSARSTAAAAVVADFRREAGPGLGLAVIIALVLLVAGSAGAAVHTA